MKATAFLLGIAALVLAGLFWQRQSIHQRERTELADALQKFSNDWKQASVQLAGQRTTNQTLDEQLEVRMTEVLTLTNELRKTATELEKTKEEIKAAAAAAAAAVQEKQQGEARIKELEVERDALTKRMGQLTDSIKGLNTEIAEAKRKLSTADGDRDYLIKELKRMQAEKTDLEKKFLDLAALQEQMRRVRTELVQAGLLEPGGVSRRTPRGGELLRRGFASQRKATNAPPAHGPAATDLNVEMRRDGGATLAPNAPAGTPR
jgi:chromosome segregation ATPase